MQHIVAVNAQHRLGVRRASRPQQHKAGRIEPGGKRLLFLLAALFEGCFPAQRGGFILQQLGIGQRLAPETPGVFCPLTTGVGPQPAQQVIGPAGVQRTVGAAHHIHICLLYTSRCV